jgi:hypothetical protein
VKTRMVTCGTCGTVIGERVADLFVSRHRGRTSSFRGPGTVFVGCTCGTTTQLTISPSNHPGLFGDPGAAAA